MQQALNHIFKLCSLHFSLLYVLQSMVSDLSKEKQRRKTGKYRGIRKSGQTIQRGCLKKKKWGTVHFDSGSPLWLTYIAHGNKMKTEKVPQSFLNFFPGVICYH